MLKSYIRAAVGPQFARFLLRVRYGASLNEVHIVEDAFRELGRKGVMIDVGAHHGGSMHGFAATGWQVFAFEPDPVNRACLEIVAKKYPNVLIDIRGVSDAPKKDVPFFTSTVSSGISGLSKFHPSHKESFRVDLTTLTDFVRDKSIRNIDFLKIDTEGFDLFVLQGFPWDTLKPECIICEYEDRKTVPLGYAVSDMFRFVESQGYDITIAEWHPLTEYGSGARFKAFQSAVDALDPKGCGNFIAYRKGSALEPLLNADALTARYGAFAR